MTSGSEMFVDTNVFIRHVTQDDPDQAARAYKFLKQIEEGTLEARTSESVVVEIVQVLSSKRLYALPPDEIRVNLVAILSMRGLRLENKRTILKALDLYASSGIDFVDALNVAHMQRLRIDTIISFDRDFDRIPDIRRRDP